MDGAAGSGSERADLELVRVAVAPDGCFGVLLIDGIPAGPVTLERTYPLAESRPGGPQFVKIPAGRYRCERTTFYRGGYESYEVTGVLGHSRLLFHQGNDEGDTEGCILVGSRFGWLGSRPAVLDSRNGFSEFMRLAHGRSGFDLLVRNPA
jgi:hypothetical protein